MKIQQRLVDVSYCYQNSWQSFDTKQFIKSRLLIQLYRFLGVNRFRVLYPEGMVSMAGSYEFAKNYAAIFDGKIVLSRTRELL